ncbi:hypothetical protein ACFE04_015387 [Oxalis oulophora]
MKRVRDDHTNCLMLLTKVNDVVVDDDNVRLFECKTCNKQFPSFQALGGHRASHKKHQLEPSSPKKVKSKHECSICGLEFPMGQALGGHMRRHRSDQSNEGLVTRPLLPTVMSLPPVMKKSNSINSKRVWGLDLNLAVRDSDFNDHLPNVRPNRSVSTDSRYQYGSDLYRLIVVISTVPFKHSNKGFWMEKGGGGHVTDDQNNNNNNTSFGSPSRAESKRPHQWFVDSIEPELFPNKKQATQDPNTHQSPEISNANIPSWDSPSSFHSVPSQFMDRLFGSETARSINFVETNISPIGLNNNLNMRNNSLDGHFGIDDPETCLSYGGIRKVKVNEVKDSDYGISLNNSFGKEDSNVLSFGGFPDDQDIIPVVQPLTLYDSSYNQSSNQISEEALFDKVLEQSNSGSVVSASNLIAKQKHEPASKVKVAKKEPTNNFPSNVRSLISTGMLDGVPVKYVSLSREELGGIIKGSGYLCGCKSCNFTKVLNAYEFERHAGCKTKHPNNHIYFENGKTIYQIVQELRNTPENMLFDAIQTVFGAPINQKSFRIWKESYQAAARELQRIYGKEEVNL